MIANIERRVEALEAHESVKEPITIIRIVTLGGGTPDEPVRAEIGGRPLLRAGGETGEAFLARVEAEAKLSSKPGCLAVALVWPRTG